MIYKGDLKTLYVKNFQVTDKGILLSLDSVLVQKNALFYRNFVGRLINFEHDTNLPSYQEAESFVRGATKPEHIGLSCLYVDYSTVRPAFEETRSVKELKKVFKAQRKGRTK